MSDCSFPKFSVEDNGKIKVVFKNFSGELTVKDIISVMKYTEILIPVAFTSAFVSKYCHDIIPPADASSIFFYGSINPIQAPAAPNTATNTNSIDEDESTIFDKEPISIKVAMTIKVL